MGHNLSQRMKPVLARQMEIYAGFLEHADHQMGRAHRCDRGLDILDDTLIYVIIGDNGASRRRFAPGSIQRDDHARRVRRTRDTRVPPGAPRQVRRTRGVQSLRGRLGACDGHALSVDEAGGVTLGWHTQRHDRPLAEGHQGERARSAPSSTT